MKTKLLFLFATALMSIQAQTVYVKRYATGLNNGTSWTNAYTDLKTALTNATSGSTVWVSGDTFYLPAASPRSASFAISNKSLTVLGGFPTTGNPTAPSRNAKLYKTILSGDINRDDPAFTSFSRKGDANRADNAYSVIDISMSGATAYTVTIDGLIIQDGNANNNSNGSDGLGAGLEFVRSSTGTAYHQVYISNCDFRYNTATKGAALNYSLVYTNVGTISLNLTSNNFYHNISDEAAILNSYIPGTATLASFYLNFTSNLVYRNRSTSNSTGILALLCQNNANASSLFDYKVNFNTFTDNSVVGGGIICAEGTTANVSNLMISNNIITNNSIGMNPIFKRAGAKNFLTNPYIDHNIFSKEDSFQILYGTSNNRIGNVNFVDASNNNYELANCEYAINHGNLNVQDKSGTNTFILNAVAKDAANKTRVMSGTIDIGALEYAGSQLPSFANISKSICSGDSLLFNGIYIKTNGTYLDTLINASNCDSIITLTLNIANIQGSITKKICMNDSFLFNGTYLKASGSYKDTLSSFLGCDSILTCVLTVYTFTPPSISVQAPLLNTLVVFGGPYDGFGWYRNDSLQIQGANLYTFNFNNIKGEYWVGAMKSFQGINCFAKSNIFSYGLQYTINASASSNGTISPSGAIVVNSNASQTFTITPNTGFQIDSLIIDGFPVTPALTYTFSNMNAAHTIRATFKLASTSGIQANAISSLNLFPNPCSEIIYLQTEDKILDVNLYKMDGALLTKPQIINNTMNTQTLSKGIYIIEIQTEQETNKLQFIKE